MNHRNDIPKIIQEQLGIRPPVDIRNNGDRIHAAVLLPICLINGSYYLVFTKRTENVPSHKGQISFPGGAADEQDKNFLDTALREADEEIGLSHSDVNFLGRTDDIQTKSSNFIVHSFVGMIPYPYPFKINPDEVAAVFHAPIDIFFSENSLFKKEDIEFRGVVYPGTAWIYQNEVIWGATARILTNFIDIMEGRLSSCF